MGFVTFRGFLCPRTLLPTHKHSEWVYLQMETKLLRERTIKVSVIGHLSSGKRSFVKRLLHKRYVDGKSPSVSFDFESVHEMRGEESIVWVFMTLPGTERHMNSCWESLQDAEAIIICRDSQAKEEDDELYFRNTKEQIRKVTQHASIFAVYTKSDGQSIDYEPYPPNLIKSIHYLGMTSAKLNTGLDGILTKLYTHLPNLPYRIRLEEEESEPCCCFM